MLCFFYVSVHPVPSTSLSRWRSADTTALTLYTDGASDHPVLKDSSPKPYCLHLQERRMNRCSTVGSSGAEAPVLARLYLDSNEASDRPTVSSIRPSDHLVLISSLLLLCNSSGASRNLTVRSSDGVIFILPPAQCTNYIDAMHRWYRRFIRRCLFFFFPFSFLTCGIFASMGPRNVYKDMLNNMVSPIDHVIMNHQNQTRTNGIWGHVRYNMKLESCTLSRVF
jgi:hypothetical protein